MQKVLIVDDDPILGELLQLHLSAAGYEVEVAADGIEGGYAVLRNRPDLILCDLVMPHMDGPTLIGALRSDHTIPAIPVIFLTGINEAEARRAVVGEALMLKPVRPSQLLEAIKAKLERPALERLAA
jgi:CheY-like chemotaxis protein